MAFEYLQDGDNLPQQPVPVLGHPHSVFYILDPSCLELSSSPIFYHYFYKLP